MDPIERTNWLAHRWPIELETYDYGGWLIHVGRVEGYRLGQSNSAEAYEKWRSSQRPICLARFIAGRRELHPPVVLVVANNYRLGRIPPELWCGYDATLLQDEPAATLLSAKARAMFPAWPGVLLRVVPQAQLASLDLQRAPDAMRPRLRLVG
ncbi:hypothetical protein ACX40Y_00370 [Sphingomonas sp. RS6]